MTNTFRSIDDLIKTLDREKVLLKEMFSKRKSQSFRYEYARELTEYKEERIKFLIEYGLIRDSGSFLELEDVYLKFFEDVLQVNEEINVSFVKDYLDSLNGNIDYYFKENNEQRRYGYLREVKRCLKQIALATVRNVMDLKRNLDNTYKNEPNYHVKLAKLKRMDEKRKNIALLITESEDVIDSKQPVFFKVTADIDMQEVVSDVKLQLSDSYHNLLEIEKQIVHYLNLIEYQNRIFEKIRKLKYLRDQIILEDSTDICRVLKDKNPVWMEPQASYRVKLSVNDLRNSKTALELIKKVLSRRNEKGCFKQILAEPIPEEYFEEHVEKDNGVSLQEVYNAFAASGMHLFKFVMNYTFRKPVTDSERILYFCQIASQFSDTLEFTDDYEMTSEVEYPIIYFNNSL